MGSENMLPLTRISAPATVKRIVRVAALAAFVVGFAPSRAAAQTTSINACQQTPLSGSVYLTATITVPSTWSGPCLTVGHDNVTVNLQNNTIDIRALGDSGVAINAGAYKNTTIRSGTIVTDYTTSAAGAAVEASGGSNLSITGLNVENKPNGSACPTTGTDPDNNFGTGILIDGVTGAAIGMNTVTCYQFGISVENSAILSGATGSISGNNLTYNANYMVKNKSEIYSAGLVLNDSSGWSVTGNTVSYDGSPSYSGQCTPPSSTTGENACSFALQIINGSTSNTLSSNTVSSNYLGGIYTSPDTAGNKITGNTALNNLGWDLWSDAPAHSNSWHHNTCGSAGGTLNPHMCHN